MALSLRSKILFAIGGSCLSTTAISIFISSREISEDMEKALIEKSRAILSRVEQSSHYVAEMNTLKGIVDETVRLYPDGNLPESQKEKILRSVPVYAALKVGKEGAEKENYEFRVASDNPRNKNNQANQEELEVINKFRSNPKLKEFVYRSNDGKSISVAAPVRIVESRNCLVCHGNPSHSPWKNGMDILGYKMENMKDGELRATFAIISSLEPVKAATNASTRDLLAYGIVVCLLAVGVVFLLIRGTVKSLGSLAEQVGKATSDVNQSSESLASSSQQLAASSQEQASSVEETSSSLEEISGMVASSLKNSQLAVELSQKVSELVQSGTQSMAQLQNSVQEISEANARVEKLGKLIEEIGEKTELIDEIVFQTRLLSFNASVEAERAGEHGRGFAVVAQEVGNLAQMSGKSAAEISQIVKNSIKEAHEVVTLNRAKVEQGVSFCNKTSQQLSSIQDAAREILGGAEHSLRSLEEQNTGIQQINQSIQLISQATQENASSAEESSSASQSLTRQGQILSQVVTNLEILVHGKSLLPEQEARTQADRKDPPPRQSAPTQSRSFKISKQQVTPKRSSFAGNAALKQEDDPWEKI